MSLARPVAVAGAIVLDRLIPEPSNQWHPVAWFGTSMTTLEQRIWSDDRRSGAIYTVTGVGIGLLAGTLVRSTTAALTIALGAGGLRRVSHKIGAVLSLGDLDEAKELLPWLVGRDPTELDASGIAAAVIESVAENSVDATVAPIFWALLAGAPGALAYRAVNTMDAMVGHHSSRFENFGWASARLDDIVNWVPARIFAGLVMVASPSRRGAILRAVRRDASAHPSPNAGVAEAAVAGALGIELGGALRYGERVEHRPRLGRGPRPDHRSIDSAVALVDRTQLIMAGALVFIAAIRSRRRS